MSPAACFEIQLDVAIRSDTADNIEIACGTNYLAGACVTGNKYSMCGWTAGRPGLHDNVVLGLPRVLSSV